MTSEQAQTMTLEQVKAVVEAEVPDAFKPKKKAPAKKKTTAKKSTKRTTKKK
jgi:hypothetical protein